MLRKYSIFQLGLMIGYEMKKKTQYICIIAVDDLIQSFYFRYFDNAKKNRETPPRNLKEACSRRKFGNFRRKRNMNTA